MTYEFILDNCYHTSCDQPVKFDKICITYYKNHVDRFIEVHSIKTGWSGWPVYSLSSIYIVWPVYRKLLNSEKNS